MQIEALAQRLIQSTRTPVLMTPRDVSVRADFLTELADRLITDVDRPVRFEQIERRNRMTWKLQSLVANRRIIRALNRRRQSSFDFCLESVIIPTQLGESNAFTVGFCEADAELPPWVERLPLG